MAFKVKLSERKRNVMALYMTFFSIAGICLLFYGLINGIDSAVYLSKSTHILDKFTSFIIFNITYLMTSGLLIGEKVVLCFALYYSRRSKKRKSLIERKYLKNISVSLFITCIFAIPTVLVMMIIQIKSISKGFNEGMTIKMQKYYSDMSFKGIIDDIQFESKCCGSEQYKDWYISGRTSSDVHQSDSVPFSCCKVDYPGICINENLPEGVHSIYTDGCGKIFGDYISSLFIKSILCWITLFFIHLMSMILFQFWRISIQNALLKGHPKLTSYSWLWGENELYDKYKRIREKAKEEAKKLLNKTSESESDSGASGFGFKSKADINQCEKKDPNVQPMKYKTEMSPKSRKQLDIEKPIFIEESEVIKKSKAIQKAHKPQPLPKNRKIPAPPVPSPRSPGAKRSELNKEKPLWRCAECGLISVYNETHNCKFHY